MKYKDYYAALGVPREADLYRIGDHPVGCRARRQAGSPTLDTPVLLPVPAGTRSGRKLRLRSRALPDDRGRPGQPLHHALFQDLACASKFSPRGTAVKEKP